MTTTAIAAVVPRQRTTVCGEIMSVVSYERPWVRTDAEVTDGTGRLLLRFLGRSAKPGLVAGSHIVAEGTPGFVGGALVMLNPRYSLTVTAAYHPSPTDTRCRGRS
jgi:hypothetical protein